MSNGVNEFRDRVLSDLSEIKETQKEHSKDIKDLHGRLSSIEGKAGILGGMMGAIASLVSQWLFTGNGRQS